MSKRITKKWTKDVKGAFGDNPQTQRGMKAEELVYEYLKSTYDYVYWHIDDSKEQIEGNDFSFRKKIWKNSYSVDVKGNLHNREFLVYIDEIRNKTNSRMMHVDVDTGWAVEYDRKSMISFVDNNTNLLRTDKNNKRYLPCKTYDSIIKSKVNYFRLFRIVRENLKPKMGGYFNRLSKFRHSMDGREDAYLERIGKTWYSHYD